MLEAQRDPRQVVRDLVQAVAPYDEREAADQRWITDWIDAGHRLLRTARPATPHRHLAVYAALLDEAAGTLMLVDHAKARAWLMPGGHVDPGEDPRLTVVRELDEELRIAPRFHGRFGSDPFFLTVTETRPPHVHTDVTMWFVFAASQDQEIVPDPAEFSACRWFALDGPAAWTGDFDPQMSRFMAKLSSAARAGSCPLAGSARGRSSRVSSGREGFCRTTGFPPGGPMPRASRSAIPRRRPWISIGTARSRRAASPARYDAAPRPGRTPGSAALPRPASQASQNR